jgi:hypothetical protein
MCYLLIIVLLLSIASQIYSQEDPNCPLSPQLVVGGYGQVTEGDANNLRDQASRSGNLIGEIPGGESFAVLEGPVCADGFNWWRVDYNGLQGWTVEGSGSDYFVLPIDAPAPTATATPPIPPVVYPLSTDNALAVGLTARVDVAGLNIRANPSRQAAMLSQTVANELVEIVGGSTEAEGYTWWQIQQEDGTVGWVVEQFMEADSFGSEKVIQTLFPLCPYTTKRLSFIAHPYIYTSAHDGTQRCVLYRLQTSDVYTTWLELKAMVNDVYWSPQGDEFIFIDYAYDTGCCVYRLYSLTADGSRRSALTPNSDVEWAAWSPDGERIALVQNNQAWVMNRDGTNRVRLSTTNNRIDYVAWYPDNQTVFYVETIPDDPNAIQIPTRTEVFLHAIGTDLSNPRELLHLDGDLQIRDAELSPDASHLILVLTEFDPDLEYPEMIGGGAYLYNTATWERNALDTYWGYLWSPDGQYLVTYDERSAIIELATGESHSLANFYPTSWSADGQRLYSTDGAGFLVYELETGETTRYLEAEGQPLESDYIDGISSVREQGTH